MLGNNKAVGLKSNQLKVEVWINRATFMKFCPDYVCFISIQDIIILNLVRMAKRNC